MYAAALSPRTIVLLVLLVMVAWWIVFSLTFLLTLLRACFLSCVSSCLSRAVVTVAVPLYTLSSLLSPQALHNLQYSNDFVGVLEHLEKSYKVAEAVLPSVFKGASAVYPKKFKVLRSAESTPVPSFQSRRAYVQNQTLDKEEHTRLMDINRNDMELYRAARRLLARRASACRLATTKPLAAARIPRLDPRLPE